MFLMIHALWQSKHGMLENPQQVALEGPEKAIDSWDIHGIFLASYHQEAFFSNGDIPWWIFQISSLLFMCYSWEYSWPIEYYFLDPKTLQYSKWVRKVVLNSNGPACRNIFLDAKIGGSALFGRNWLSILGNTQWLSDLHILKPSSVGSKQITHPNVTGNPIPSR